MTPKEKAEELYWKYAEILYLLHDVRLLKNSYAKKSALIAVDEILNHHSHSCHSLCILIILQIYKKY